jgi:putative Mn2+ efflux pump MntP
MTTLDIGLIAVGLAMDAFAVAVAVGLHLSCVGAISRRQYFRLGFHFGLFQFLMPIIGWLAGLTVRQYIAAIDHWLAFGLLAYIGGKMIYEARDGGRFSRADPTRGVSLIVLSVATSIDALATGLSLAFLGEAIIYPALVIGSVAAILTLIGLGLGQRIGQRWQVRAATVGGLVLIAIGIKIVLEHTL